MVGRAASVVSRCYSILIDSIEVSLLQGFFKSRLLIWYSFSFSFLVCFFQSQKWFVFSLKVQKHDVQKRIFENPERNICKKKQNERVKVIVQLSFIIG